MTSLHVSSFRQLSATRTSPTPVLLRFRRTPGMTFASPETHQLTALLAAEVGLAEVDHPTLERCGSVLGGGLDAEKAAPPISRVVTRTGMLDVASVRWLLAADAEPGATSTSTTAEEKFSWRQRNAGEPLPCSACGETCLTVRPGCASNPAVLCGNLWPREDQLSSGGKAPGSPIDADLKWKR